MLPLMHRVNTTAEVLKHCGKLCACLLPWLCPLQSGLWRDLLQEGLGEKETWHFVQLESSEEGGRC